MLQRHEVYFALKLDVHYYCSEGSTLRLSKPRCTAVALDWHIRGVGPRLASQP